MALSERTPDLCRIPSRRSRMRATKSRVSRVGFVKLPLFFAQLLAARLDPLRMQTGLLASPLLENDGDGTDHHGKAHQVIPLQRLTKI